MLVVYPGTAIWANLVEPGMIIDVDGESFPVEFVVENCDSLTFHSNGETVEVDWAALVTVLGYFNP